jgi:putative two-component system hydrogenase maturation factor HypX/HoxX
MRILFLVHAFNSLTQRLFVALRSRGHQVSVEFDIADSVSLEAVALFRPDLIIAPFLKRAIAEPIWRHHVCLVLHPGIVGDRGPSALDWAILEQECAWGVTVLQANGEMDGGDVWAHASFAMRSATKSSVYRVEVTNAALHAVCDAVDKFARGEHPVPLADLLAGGGVRGRWRPSMRQQERRIDWQVDASAVVLAKIHAADGAPGVLDSLFGTPCHLYDAHPVTKETLEIVRRHGGVPGAIVANKCGAPGAVVANKCVAPGDIVANNSGAPGDIVANKRGAPGDIVARRDHAVLRLTADGAVWIGHARLLQADGEAPFKLPVADLFAQPFALLPDMPAALMRLDDEWGELRYREEGEGAVGLLSFDFYNGAMSTGQCRRLQEAVKFAKGRPTRVLVLLGGEDFFSNGIHLNRIEASAHRPLDSAADESWNNIHAIDDLVLEIIHATDHLTISALRGNAGAGGAFLALASDLVWAHENVLLNPHYKNMGNLHGSEYWTYLLPQRLGEAAARALMQERLPLGAFDALAMNLIDAVFGVDGRDFAREAALRAAALAQGADAGAAARVARKRLRRAQDEAIKPLQAYRDDELARIHRNFYGFDPSYHIARYHFVYKMAHAWTPRHLALHRNTALKGSGTPDEHS